MQLIRTLIILITAASTADVAHADSADTNNGGLEQDGFSDVARLLQAMAPSQRDAILKQAAIKEKDLQKLTPQQLGQLRKQLRAIANTIDFDKIDPAKLDASKAQSTGDIQKNFGTYQQKYQQGTLTNAVVKQ